MRIFSADFETRAGDAALLEGRTYVWAWCLIDLQTNEEITGNTIEHFIAVTSKLGNCLIYFHNLKFDGSFIVYELLTKGYKHTQEFRPKKGEFSTVISESGVWYEVTYCTGYRNTVTIHDSLKKLPFSVREIGKAFKTQAQKLELEYELEREERHIMTPEEREYLLNDVRVITEALNIQYDEGMDHMTIGADCLARYVDMLGGLKEFRKHFPVLEAEEDHFIRRSYKGGWCFVLRPGYYENVDGYTADVNSLYPSMMHSSSGNYFPIGKGVYYKGEYKKDPFYPLYVQHVIVEFELKHGYLPTVQVKGSPEYPANEWLRETKGPLELYLTNVDLELLMSHYDIIYLSYIDGYKYQAGIGLFDKYIDHFMSIKMHEKGALRALAKLFLNNLYGKFATKIEQADKIPFIGEDEKLHFKLGELHSRDPIYIPIGTFVTAYARRFTITAAQKNYDIFCYADTDSIHCTAKPEGIEIDDARMSCWKLESRWNKAKFVRQKTYAELVDDEWDIKCAGMDKESKDEFRRMMNDGEKTIADFDIGLTIEGKKLRPKQVKGGVILEPTLYTMHESNFLFSM